MAERFNAFLDAFANIFRSDGPKQYPQTIDLESPIQPVADVSRLAARGRYFRGSAAVAIPAAPGGSARDSVSMAGQVDLAIGLDVNRVDFWLVDAALLIEHGATGNFTRAILGAVESTLPPTGSSESYVWPLRLWSSYVAAEIVAGSGWDPGVPAAVEFGSKLPVLLTPSSSAVSLKLLAVGSDACNVRVLYRLWYGPRGATPPGLS